ncbi:hypothetical protein [Actinokineospora iranica]|uniref:Uncharacterized protein n=1 Tax=Actinokineospora iranica TaxID=1271860 RepID=A0A1G6XE91_9PSEU|nr:hypothetical protein [Actinokineospora iranica]SDD75556.1 hypothetical protein SAMN05216174_11719 [Actinokineospora iranica]
MLGQREWESVAPFAPDRQAEVIRLIEAGEAPESGAFRTSGPRMAGLLALGLLLALSPDPDEKEPIEDSAAARSMFDELAFAL